MENGFAKSVVFGPDGKTVADAYQSTSGSGVVLWDWSARNRLADDLLRVAAGEYKGMPDFSADGETVVAAYSIDGRGNGRVAVWAVARRKRLADWAIVALGLGLNHFTAIAWPATVVGGLAALIENPTVAPNEMLSNSKAISDLRASADQGIPYVMLAGNNSIISAATSSTDSRTASPLGRLIARLCGAQNRRRAKSPGSTDLGLHKQRRDISLQGSDEEWLLVEDLETTENSRNDLAVKGNKDATRLSIT